MDIKLEIKNEIIYSNSLEIAENIGTRHDRILRKYDEKKAYFTDPILGVSEEVYKDNSGKTNRYLKLNKEATELLISLFNTEKAILAKIEYIKEFNNMQQYILETNQAKEYYQWVDRRIVEAKETYEFYNLIGNKGKCIALSKCLYDIISYKCNLDFKHNKEQIFQLSLNTSNKKPWCLYQEVKETAETYVKYWMKKNPNEFMHNVIQDLLDEYIEDRKEFEIYCKSHERNILVIERNIDKGFGRSQPLIIE